jgi:hypothetical protein
MLSRIILLACLVNSVASKTLRGFSYNPPIYNHSLTHAHLEQIKPIKYTYTEPVSSLPYNSAGYTTDGEQKSTSLRYV